MTLEKFLKSKPYLTWYIADKKNISPAVAVEMILNYGNWQDVKKLIKILGIKKVAEIFKEKSKKSKIGRTNYRPEVINYFSLYFKKYA